MIAHRSESLPLWYAAKTLLAEKHLAGRAANAVNSFIELIDQIEDQYSR
ncbi:hypothetical protein [Pseudoalteromonas spongiae]|nr:hypothetical protein [Pseudoalteromonas spongiae]